MTKMTVSNEIVFEGEHRLQPLESYFLIDAIIIDRLRYTYDYLMGFSYAKRDFDHNLNLSHTVRLYFEGSK